MKFINANAFRIWLEEKLKSPYAEYVMDYEDIFNDWLEEVEKAVYNDCRWVEIPAREAKSGHAEEYYFTVDIKMFGDREVIYIEF